MSSTQKSLQHLAITFWNQSLVKTQSIQNISPLDHIFYQLVLKNEWQKAPQNIWDVQIQYETRKY